MFVAPELVLEAPKLVLTALWNWPLVHQYKWILLKQFLQIRSIDVEALERNLGSPGSTNLPDPSSENVNKFVITGWNLFAQATDRILFIIYLLIIFIVLGAYLGGASVIIDKFTK